MYNVIQNLMFPSIHTPVHSLTIIWAGSRDQLTMLPIIICCSAHKCYLLCSKLCSRRIVISLFSLPYSTKFWQGKTLVDLANRLPFTNILPSQIPDSLK